MESATALISVMRRHAAKVAVGEPGECWEWTAGRVPDGYGMLTVGNTMVGAHVVAHTLAHGAVSAGEHVLHSCDNPSCCNPAHLRAGTPLDNGRDRRERGRSSRERRTHCARGHALTDDNVYVSGRSRQCRTCALDRRHSS